MRESKIDALRKKKEKEEIKNGNDSLTDCETQISQSKLQNFRREMKWDSKIAQKLVNALESVIR